VVCTIYRQCCNKWVPYVVAAASLASYRTRERTARAPSTTSTSNSAPLHWWVIRFILYIYKSIFPGFIAYIMYGPTNPHGDRMVCYGPFSLWMIYKEGLCPSSGDINRLMMMYGQQHDTLYTCRSICALMPLNKNGIESIEYTSLLTVQLNFSDL
jgi:hypothetical protein